MPRAWWCQPRCFEDFGFNYIGPIDGHDLRLLIPTLENIARARRARSSCTWSPRRAGLQAGRGRPDRLTTAPASSTRQVGMVSRAASHAKPTFTQVFGQWLCDMAAARQAPGGHHPGDARRLGHGGVHQALPGALLRRRHRRAARGDLCRRPGLRGRQARGGDLLHLPAARATTS